MLPNLETFARFSIRLNFFGFCNLKLASVNVLRGMVEGDFTVVLQFPSSLPVARHDSHTLPVIAIAEITRNGIGAYAVSSR